MSRDLQGLGDEIGVPVMGRWPWLRAWSEAFSHLTPLLVEVRAAESEQLVAAAFLALVERPEGTTVVAMGHGSSLFTAFQARDEASAHMLAATLASTLGEIRGPWSVDIEQVHELDPTLHRLAEQLRNAQVLPELRVPRVVFSTAHHIDDVLTKSMRKQLRRAYRKLEVEGKHIEIAFDRGAAIAPGLIDEVEEIHISRDHGTRRRSDLDLPAERAFWREVVEANGGDWEIEIASLRIDGELAAYVVAIIDGDTYRVYDGRMRTSCAPYSPGRLLEAAALSRAMHDPQFAVLDWMSGVAAEKLLAANLAEGRARLVATSGSRAFLDAPMRVQASTPPRLVVAS